MGPDPLDLMHQGADRVIASYLLETNDGLALFDCGPSTCLPRLKAALLERGVELGDVRHLLLSHIHLDHAGAAGVLVREHPQLHVHVSEIGAPHLADPSRLETSARRLYGDTFDTLWGELAPVPQENIRTVAARVIGLDCFPTQGHASHHVSYLDTAGTLYAGDAAGVRIHPERTVLPPTPPPDFDLDVWLETIDEIERRRPERLALIHFGVVSEPAAHLDELRRRLVEWVRLVQSGVTQEQFSESVRSEVTATADDVELYARAMPFWQSYAGLKRYTRTHAG
ncbi:MAG TPA: MBL fold metallo-hydrolase [Gaiellaceae bacterium]|jgi:glyoxylase-like metal-dependent hydrolase (beta-lactamase superfamily II)|nr:MBL fold metallo-hydrolase [Gaiellaceae bacterium]